MAPRGNINELLLFKDDVELIMLLLLIWFELVLSEIVLLVGVFGLN